MAETSDIWPSELRLSADKRHLTVSFEAGPTYDLAAEYLRVLSPSAEVQGHGPGQKQTVSGKAGITIAALEPVGHYAVRIVFSDGHDTGLYTWRYLAELGQGYEVKWAEYIAELAHKGLIR